MNLRKMRDYYTPTKLSELLIETVPERNYSNVIDICCGGWNLLKAAKERFPNALVHGVDIDSEALNLKPRYGEFTLKDGREYAITALSKNIRYDLVVANPPFHKSTYSIDKQKITKLFPLFENVNSNRLEVQMIIANLSLLASNGILAAIVPDTFISGNHNQLIRKLIATEYSILKIIELPVNTFKGGIHTYLLVIENKPPTKSPIIIEKAKFINDNWILRNKFTTQPNQYENGNWVIPIIESKNNINTFRGNINSGMFTDSGNEVLHNSTLKADGSWEPSIRFYDPIAVTKPKYVSSGDLIFCRIGKSAGNWIVYNGKRTAISDCLIAISRCEQVENFLSSPVSNQIVDLLSKGVSTRFISKIELENLILSL